MKKKVSKKKKAEGYFLNMRMGTEDYSSGGKTLDEAIQNLKLPKIYSKGIFTFTKDGKTSKPTYLFIPQIKQLFGRGLTSQIHRTVLIKKLMFLA